MANQYENNALDFRNPGPISDALLSVPGFVDDLRDHTLESGYSPNKVLAFSGALAMLAHLSGRTYRDAHGTRTNLYLVALGDTGIGKDEPRRVNRRLALLHAISADPAAPVITAEGVDWAIRFVRHVTEDMLFESQFHVAEGRFDALVKRFVGLLAKNGGQLDRRTLIKNLHVDHGTFKRITLTLHMCDMIDEEHLSGRKTVFSLKDAA